jgi:flagellar basal-body rod modification protein FlgD
MSIDGLLSVESGSDGLRTLQSLGLATNMPAPEKKSMLPVQTLGQDEFLQLLVAQLVHQDPLNPQKDTEFIAQMASFTTLEQTKAMHGDIVKMRDQSQVMEAVSYMDREVLVRTGAGEMDFIAGVVTGLIKDGKETKVLVGDNIYSLNQIITVQPKL